MGRTTIDLDDKLIEDALSVSEEKTKKGVIEEALRELVNAKRRERLIARIGSGDIDMTLEELKAWRDKGKARIFSRE